MLFLVVFDTNVLFSAVGWRGTPFRCLELARQGLIIGIVSSAILDEMIEKLQTKLRSSEARALAEAENLMGFRQRVDGPGQLKVVVNDPDDDAVLECAVVAGAQYLVTGDRHHLLPLGTYNGVDIVTPNQLLTIVKTRQNGHTGSA